MPEHAPLKPIAEVAVDKVMDAAFDDPIKFMDGMDSFLTIAAKVMPTTPEQFPIPIPLGLFEHIKGDKK